jgi:hypothetical protein
MSRLSEYRAFAALARAQGQRESARHWEELAYAAQRDLGRQKPARYNELAAMDTANQTDEEIQEQTDLYYEIYHPQEGFFVGQQVYERDTMAPGTITAIDEDGIAEVLFTNGSTDGVSLEHLVSNKE